MEWRLSGSKWLWTRYLDAVECQVERRNRLWPRCANSRLECAPSVTEAVERQNSGPHSFGSGTGSSCGRGHPEHLTLFQNDPFSGISLMSKHTKCGQGRQALEVYEEMRECGVKPSSYMFVVALKACGTLQDMARTEQIHAQVLESGFESDVYVGTVLVDVYLRCGSLVKAKRVFDKMPHRDVVCWSSMIMGYAHMNEGELALQLYAQMQLQGITPNDRTFVSALKACSSMAALEEATDTGGIAVKRYCLEQVRTIHSQVVKSGCELAVFVGTMLVDVYAKCGSLLDARRVFERMPHRNVVTWTALILGYAQIEEGEVALKLYAQMQQDCVVPNDHTYVAVLKACSSLAVLKVQNEADAILLRRRCLEQARTIQATIFRSRSELGVFVGTMLVDVYAKCHSLVEARGVFERMPDRNVVSWNAIILGYAQMEEGEEALHLYTKMQQEGVVPDDRTFLGALKACSSLASVKEGNQGDELLITNKCYTQVKAIHLDIVKTEAKSNVFLGTMLVDVYAKCGCLVDARRVFENMPHRNVVSWTAMILGYVQIQEGELALQLYARMQQEGVTPDDLTFIAALKACSGLAALGKGKEIHAQILRAGPESTDLVVANTLIDMYSKCGSMVDAEKVFDTCPARDVVTWNALMAGYAHHGESDVVLDLFERMRLEGIQPNGTTFLSVLTVCNHVGLVHKSRNYFQAMSRDYGISPTIEHYNCLVDLLGRAGHLEKVMAIIEAMPFKADIAIWQTVLGACRKWNNLDLGKQAFERAVRLDKDEAAVHVLMSNIYAANCLWDDVEKIQEMRLSTRAWKKPGKSWWIDSHGALHPFVVGERDRHIRLLLPEQLEFVFVKMREDGDVWGAL